LRTGALDVKAVSGLVAAIASSCLLLAAQAAAPDNAELTQRLDRWRAELPQGTGPHEVVRLVEADLPEHTVYRPADLQRAGVLPIISFANGACRNTSIEYAAFLSELASYGYLVIAVGQDDQPFEVGPDAPRTSPDGRPVQVMDENVLVAAVDWALARNADSSSPYHRRLKGDRIAYMGHSCGGMQALTAGADKRATTTVVLNSGYYRTIPAKPPGPLPAYRRWSELRTPTLILAGGPKDVAYRIAKESYEDGAAAKLPIFFASLPTVAHSGAYVAPDREWSRVVLSWVDWQLKGSNGARGEFIGGRCGLCTNASWQDVQGNGLR
jgi:dienelactone hydrolase